MVYRAQSAHLFIRWVVADTVYGHSPDLRQWLEAQGYSYALAVPSAEVVCVQTPAGCLLSDVGRIASHQLRARDWQRLSQSQGTKGEHLFDWAILPWVQAGSVDGRHFLVIRRCLDDPDELAFYLVFASLPTSLPTIVQAIGARWHSEEDLHAGKALGLDQYEVRSYASWARHVTLVLLAYAFLVSICIQQGSPGPVPQGAPDSPLLIPLTTSEVRHLLARLFFPAPTSAPLVCQWSRWRRAHQYWAGYYHRRRREKTGEVCLSS
jgi:SRSO17 transposase